MHDELYDDRIGGLSALDKYDLKANDFREYFPQRAEVKTDE